MHYYQLPSGNIVEHPTAVRGEGYKEIRPSVGHRFVVSNYGREIMAHLAHDPRIFVEFTGERARVTAPAVGGVGRADLTICIAMIYELRTQHGTLSRAAAQRFVCQAPASSLLGALLDAAHAVITTEEVPE